MTDQNPTQETPLSGCFVRLFWMMFGNLLLVIFFLLILRDRALFSYVDILYWATVAALVAVRYIDIKHFHGDTVNGKPATMKDWLRYSITIFAIASAIWGCGHWL
mgnify:CR=1 FL=1